MQSNYQNNINIALKELSTTKNISSALLVCKTLLEYMGIETKNVEDIELSKLKLPNAERYDRWFDAHPHFRGDRACFDLTPKDTNLDAKFFALQKKTKLFIAGSVNFTPNFEDRDYTRNDPNMKVGIDFFFTPEKDSVIVVLSNKGSLRLVELSGRLTNTQNDIFNLWHNVAQTSDKNILHTTIWESFKLSSLNKKFYEGIANSFLSLTQHLQKNNVDEQLSNQFANRLHGRLLFLWFLRKKNIINESKEYFNIDGQSDTDYYRGKLAYLFFDVLNTDISDREKVQKEKNTLFGKEKEEPSLFVLDSKTPYLNGGLFDQDADGEYWNKNKPTFPTGFFRALYDHFDSFNFTTDESTPEYEQIAIDPEMLGRIFESFLATLTTETGAQAKKANGAFYTPREIVSYMSRESLRQYLYTSLDAGTTLKTSIDDLLDRPDSEWALAGTNSKRDTVSKEDRERIMNALRKVKVLDPAVGSGAFPMGVLHKILSLFERLEPNFDSYETKLSILQNNIYGVDIDPTAIEISRLRAWLSIIVDVKDTKKIKPLPNLDFKFVCANSLIGLEKSLASFSSDDNLKPELIRIRDEYYATSSKIKKEKLQKEYTKLTHKDSLFDNRETIQLKSYKPFENGKSASFYDSELMHGVEKFNVVIGNPPYVQIQKFSGQQVQKDLESQNYETFGKTSDLYCIFYERGINFLDNKGILTFITSNKWMRAGYGEKIRKLFLKYNPILLVDLGPNIFESATVDTNILIIKKEENKNEVPAITITDEWKQTGNLGKHIQDNYVVLKNLNDSPWSISNDTQQELKLKIEKKGKALRDWDIKINYGIKTGLNEAFVIDNSTKDDLIAADPKNAEIIKPLLRGRDVEKYQYLFADKYLLMTGFDIDIPKLYPAILRHLTKFEDKAKKRDDQGKNWYNLRSCAYYEEFEKEKVVWQEMSQHPSFAYDIDGVYTNDTCRILTGTNIKFFVGLFNSKLFEYIFANYYAGGGLGEKGIRYKSEFMKNVPVPEISNEKEKELLKNMESLVDKIIEAKKIDSKSETKDIEDQIDTLVYKLYGLTEDEIRVIETKK